MSRAAHALLVAFASAPPALAQDQSEHQLALRNASFVPTCEPALQRRLDEGLRQLREGNAKAALERLLPALTPGQESPLIAWGERETRSFHELLETHLREVPAAVRDPFLAGLAADAAKTLSGVGRERIWLDGVLAGFPGTAAALGARRRLCDLALESGDAVEAARWLWQLPAAEQGPRRTMVDDLEKLGLRASAWPCSSGGPTGVPRPLKLGTPTGRPHLAGRWKTPFTNHRRAGGVVGLDEHGRPLAVWQAGTSLRIARRTGDGVDLKSISIQTLTGIVAPPTTGARPSPTMLGDRLFLVHGGVLMRLRRAATPLGFVTDWRWSPNKPGQNSLERATLHPYALASGGRVWVVLTHPEDRLHSSVHVACVNGNTGQLLWTRYITKGAVLSAELSMHRQETLDRSAVEPAPPILARGRLVVSTGLGVIAALDPVRGTIAWTLRTARVKSARGREQPWAEVRLLGVAGEAWVTPSDSVFSYRLHLWPGMRDVLAAHPGEKRSLTRLIGVSDRWNASYWFRRGLSEAGPRRILTRADPDRPMRYDPPPIAPGESLTALPLLTDTSLILTTDNSLYWLDLRKDLYYEHVIGLRAHGPGGFGPALPLDGAIVVAGKRGVLLWQ